MRYFELVNHLTIPRPLLPGEGNKHHRPCPGDVIAIPDDACARESRFVNGRKRAGDWKEVDEAAYLAHVKRCEERKAKAEADAKASEESTSEAQTTPTEAPAAVAAPAVKAAKGK